MENSGCDELSSETRPVYVSVNVEESQDYSTPDVKVATACGTVQSWHEHLTHDGGYICKHVSSSCEYAIIVQLQLRTPQLRPLALESSQHSSMLSP